MVGSYPKLPTLATLKFELKGFGISIYMSMLRILIILSVLLLNGCERTPQESRDFNASSFKNPISVITNGNKVLKMIEIDMISPSDGRHYSDRIYFITDLIGIGQNNTILSVNQTKITPKAVTRQSVGFDPASSIHFVDKNGKEIQYFPITNR